VSHPYDANGNLQSVTDLDGGVTTFTYDANHLLLTMTDPRNDGSLINVYDANGRAVQQTDPANQITKFSYGPAATTITYPNGDQELDQVQNNAVATRVTGYGSGLASTTPCTYDHMSMGVDA